jgi:hypothetical protein
MIRNFAIRSFLAGALLAAPSLYSQTAQFGSPWAGLSSSVSTNSSSAAAAAAVNPASAANVVFSPTTALMVANRARTLGDKPSGSGTRYFSATDLDLSKLTPQQRLQRLSPAPVVAGDGVRKLEISIDLKDPLFVEAQSGQSIDIGSADIKAQGHQNVEVNASIFLNGVNAINK